MSRYYCTEANLFFLRCALSLATSDKSDQGAKAGCDVIERVTGCLAVGREFRDW